MHLLIWYVHIWKSINSQSRIEEYKKKPINFLFKVFNADGTKNGKVTKVTLLEVKINGYKEHIEAAVTDLNGTDMFLGYNQLVKHNLEVNWKEDKI